MNYAETITQEEWNELYELPIVMELFNVRALTAADLPSYLWGAKFSYADEGTIYTLMRKHMSGEALMIERQADGTLKMVQSAFA